MLAAVAFLGGCAATVNRPGAAESPPARPAVETSKFALLITGSQAIQASQDGQTFKAEWRTAFNTAASAAGLGFA